MELYCRQFFGRLKSRNAGKIAADEKGLVPVPRACSRGVGPRPGLDTAEHFSEERNVPADLCEPGQGEPKYEGYQDGACSSVDVQQRHDRYPVIAFRDGDSTDGGKPDDPFKEEAR